MKNTIPEVDVYIEQAADFAKPILTKIRQLFHKACPELQETVKWSTPFFEYKGTLGGMSAHKQHVNLVFWKGRLMEDTHQLFSSECNSSMYVLKLTSLSDMTKDKILLDYMKQAVKINEDGTKIPKQPKAKTKADLLPIPDELTAALKKNKKAQAAFDKFSNSHKNEYSEWIGEAKRESTRQKRIETALEWLTEGKPRHWKYMK